MVHSGVYWSGEYRTNRTDGYGPVFGNTLVLKIIGNFYLCFFFGVFVISPDEEQLLLSNTVILKWQRKMLKCIILMTT